MPPKGYRLSCLLQFLLLSHSLPFLSCKELHSFRLHFIQPFASSHTFIPFRLLSFKPLCSPAAASLNGSPACRSGLRDGKGFGKLYCFNDYIFNNLNPCHPLCCKQHRSQSPSLHFVSLRAFSASTLAPFAVVRRCCLNLFRLQPVSLIAAFTSFLAQGCLNLRWLLRYTQ